MCEKCGKRFLAAMAFLAGSGTGLNAAEVFSPPEGCEAFLTVQSASCEVNILWRCDIAPDGDKWEAYFDRDGLQSIASYSSQYAWLDAVYMWDSSREEATGSPIDPISLAMLVLNDVDSYDFQMRRTDDSGTRNLRVVGTDTLTGEEQTIDGQLLQVARFEYDILEDDGALFYRSFGTQLFSPEMMVFFAAKGTSVSDDSTFEYDSTPVDFIFPGEPGFAGTTPLYGCDGGGEPAPAPTGPIKTGPGQNNNK